MIDADPAPIRLGLIGAKPDPALVELLEAAAGLHGLTLFAECLDDRQGGEGLGADAQQALFDDLFERARAQGFDGLCVGAPFLQRAFVRATIADADAALTGLVDTVVFAADRSAHGFHAGQSAFVSVFCETIGLKGPGTTCVIGAGSAGRAIAFGLLSLGVRRLRLADIDLARAQHLGEALRQASPRLDLVVGDDAQVLIDVAVEGVINATPMGSLAMPGQVLPAQAMAGRRWALDIVAEPWATGFLRDAQAAGAGTISGAELRLHRAAQVFRQLTGLEVTPAALRANQQA